MPAVVRVTGIAETQAALLKVAERLGPEAVERELLAIGRDLRDELRPLAPVGETGNLRKAIIAKRGPRKGKTFSSAIVMVDKKIAPHLHLVTGGTKPHEIVAKVKGALAHAGTIFGRSVHHPGTKPNPYFENAVAARLQALSDRLTAALARLIQ